MSNRWQLISKESDVPLERFIEALKLCFEAACFNFNNTSYSQTFGLPMGSPLSHILSNLVMEDLEISCLAKLPFPVPFYVRYVDDILLCVPKDSVEVLLETFNSYHPRLQFTVETSMNNKINFLDVTVINNVGNVLTDWYHKPTWSRKYLNFESHHPVKQKIGVIYGLVDRGILLSDSTFHLKNLE